jgi:hypothetical protein
MTTVVNLGVSVLAFRTKDAIDKADMALHAAEAQLQAADLSLRQHAQAAEEQLHQRVASVEESKERTARYTFVKTTLADLLSKEANQQLLAANMIRLALDDDEANKLFMGLSLDTSPASLRQAGQAGLSVIKGAKDNDQLAAQKEREGFEALLAENYVQSLEAFGEAETAVPGYHSAYEMTLLLKRLQPNPTPAQRQELLDTIASKHVWGVPLDLRERLRTRIAGLSAKP